MSIPHEERANLREKKVRSSLGDVKELFRAEVAFGS
jgi:hypothetical protein